MPSLVKLSGFVLVENMVAIVLLAIGAMGIAVSTASAIKINTDNQARAMAVAVATKTLEPVYITALAPGVDSVDFATRIRNYMVTNVVDGVTIQGNVAAGASEDFVVSVSEAVDAIGTNVLTTDGPYVSPVTVAVRVLYSGNSGRTNAAGVVEISDIKEARASFTYVLPDPAVVVP